MYSLSEEPLITRRQIDERLKELAESIKAENFDMFLSTLTGGFMFTADLCRNIASSKLEIEFIRASSYGDRTETSGDVEISGFEGLNIQGKKVLLCAGDTFRAAAADQLEIWANRAGVDIVRHEEGSDPAAVVYDGICAGKARDMDVIIIDTLQLLDVDYNRVSSYGHFGKDDLPWEQ